MTLWCFCIAFIGQILALLVVGFGFWMSTHNDECRRSLTIPVIALGGVIFLMCASHLHPASCGIYLGELSCSTYNLAHWRFMLQIAHRIPWCLEEHFLLALDSILAFP